jgi:hypothetical protein
MNNDLRVLQIAVPLHQDEIKRLRELRKRGVFIGHWVATAIREKSVRERAARSRSA